MQEKELNYLGEALSWPEGASALEELGGQCDERGRDLLLSLPYSWPQFPGCSQFWLLTACPSGQPLLPALPCQPLPGECFYQT